MSAHQNRRTLDEMEAKLTSTLERRERIKQKRVEKYYETTNSKYRYPGTKEKELSAELKRLRSAIKSRKRTILVHQITSQKEKK
jgi:predicted solute-binding protein